MTPNSLQLENFTLDNKSVLITGGTGTFGNAFVKYVLDNFEPRRLVIFSRDENKQYEMAQIYSPTRYRFLRYFIGDVRDYQRLETAMRDVDTVIHAAAMKHVPIAEYNPFECIHTNVLGAENVVRAAIRNNVEKVLALSTDKAANPINLYGASKLAADKIFIAGNNMGGRIGTIFSVLRYGNVAGSRGSVIPFFNKLVANGTKDLPITDERMTRFWITIEEGVRYAAWAISVMQGGEMVIPKIPSVRVTDIAKAIAPNLPIKIVGIRPGEKLHETLLTGDESRYAKELGHCYLVEPTISAQLPESTSETWWGQRGHALRGTALEDGFSYSSENNTDWMTVEDIQAYLKS